MKNSCSLFLVVAIAFSLVACGSMAFAADTAAKAPAAKPAATPAAKPAEAAKPAAKVAPPVGVEAVVKGKVECKSAKNRRDQEVKRCTIAVSEAKGADGKPIDALKGKSLRIAGPKAAEAEKFADKEAEIKGSVVQNERIRLESIK